MNLNALAITLQSCMCMSEHLSCNFHPVSHATECMPHCVLKALLVTECNAMRMHCNGIALHRKLIVMTPNTAATTGCQGHWITKSPLACPSNEKHVKSNNSVGKSGLF